MQVVGSKGGSESSWLYERQVVPLLNGANIKKSDSALIAALSLADLRQLSAKPFVRQALQQLEPQAAEVGKPNEVRPLAAVSGPAGADSSILPALAASGDLEQIKAFLGRQVGPDIPVSTLDRALMCAVIANHEEIVKLLVAHGANIDSLGTASVESVEQVQKAQHHDISAQSPSMVLLPSMPPRNGSKKTAARGRQQRGRQQGDGSTAAKTHMPPPAHLATQSASAIAKLNVATALHVAVDAGNASMVRLLVSLGASIHIPAGRSNTTVSEMIKQASAKRAALACLKAYFESVFFGGAPEQQPGAAGGAGTKPAAGASAGCALRDALCDLPFGITPTLIFLGCRCREPWWSKRARCCNTGRVWCERSHACHAHRKSGRVVRVCLQ
jgi:hypothetical protein